MGHFDVFIPWMLSWGIYRYGSSHIIMGQRRSSHGPQRCQRHYYIQCIPTSRPVSYRHTYRKLWENTEGPVAKNSPGLAKYSPGHGGTVCEWYIGLWIWQHTTQAAQQWVGFGSRFISAPVCSVDTDVCTHPRCSACILPSPVTLLMNYPTTVQTGVPSLGHPGKVLHWSINKVAGRCSRYD